MQAQDSGYDISQIHLNLEEITCLDKPSFYFFFLVGQTFSGSLCWQLQIDPGIFRSVYLDTRGVCRDRYMDRTSFPGLFWMQTMKLNAMWRLAVMGIWPFVLQKSISKWKGNSETQQGVITGEIAFGANFPSQHGAVFCYCVFLLNLSVPSSLLNCKCTKFSYIL